MMHTYAAVKKTSYCTMRDFDVHVCEWNPRLVIVLHAFIWRLQNRFQLMISWKLPQTFGVAKKIVAWITNSFIFSSFQRILTYIGPIPTLWAWLSCFCLEPAPVRLLHFFKTAENQNQMETPNPQGFSQQWLMHSDLVTLLSFHSIGTF